MKTIIKLTFLNLLLILCSSQITSLFAQPNLPLMQIGDLEYQGAFTIPQVQPDGLSANYSTGTIAYNSANGSLFLSGFLNSGIIAEFSIPALSSSTNVSGLNQATVLQNFRAVLNQTSNGNPQAIDRITGMTVINGKLVVNGEEFYDAPADNTHTTLVIENPANLASSPVTGYYSLNGAAHAAGWISAVPGEWQSSLGGSYIAGNSSKYSINARLPMGITAFAFNPSNLNGNPSSVSTTTLLDFSLSNPLYADYNYQDANYNLIAINGNNTFTGHTAADANVVVGSNNLWTEESQASYGFIVPGTSTYLTIGASGGHNSGIGYKPTQSNGNLCPGPCPYDANDYYNYYWLWDVNELLAVKNGQKNPHDVRPYAYGVFNAPFQTDAYTGNSEFHAIKGGTYDANNGILYLAIEDGGSTGAYDRVPVITAYKIGGGGNNCTVDATCNDGNNCTTGSTYDANCNCTGGTFQDADNDGVCAANDPNDNDPCVPNPCNGSGCELLTNTNFDNNTDPWIYWGSDVASVNGVASITNMISSTQSWEVGFIQSNIPMEQGENYTIKFRARADANRSLNVRIEQSGGQYTEYYSSNVNLTTNMQNYTLNFTMNESTDNAANFIFYMGGNQTSVYIDNASLEKADCGSSCPEQGQNCNDNNPCTTGETYDANCNCNGGTFQDADGDGVCAANDPNDNDPCVPNSCGGDDCELLTNINFDNNTNNWVEWGANVASVGGVANITNINPGVNPWDVGFSQSNQNTTLVQGETYEVTFRARADANREMYLYVGMLNSPYTAYHYQTVNLTPNMQQFTATFTMNSATDNNVSFDFNLGGNETNTYIDYASLRKANCGSSCPEQGQNCNDNNPCTTGETYDANCNCNGGTFQDADNDGVCDANDACPGTNDAVIGTACDDGDNCTTGETYNANCNCTGGTSQDADGDGVCAANDPNDNDPCVPNPCNGGDCELLTNTNFDNNTNNWVEWGANVAAVGGVANITNINPGVNPWDVGFSQSQQNITLVQGETYEVSFRASADANREMYLYVGMLNSPYTAYHYQTVNLTPNMQQFTATFTMNSATDNNISFDFNLGGNAANTYIDYASLRKVNCDGGCPAAGTICNDGDSNTTNDVEDGFCNCSGTPINPPTADCDCPDLSTNGTVVSVSNMTQLQNAINNSNGNQTIMVQPGDYVLNYGLIISADKPNLTIMGATGNWDDVTLRGRGWNNSAVTHIFDVSADGFTVANMTISDVYYHLVQIHSENDADDFTAQNVRFLNAKEQLLKVSAGASTFSDRGRILCCSFEFTNGIAYQNYTGGIDAHKSKDWLVQNNTFKGIRSPDDVVAEHAIHFWRDCENTTVIGNQIERCDRGVGFGLGNLYENGHRGGLIMNNFIHTNRDVGIGLEYAPDIRVYNNTIITDNYFNSIEYRFTATTNLQIANNIVSQNIASRDGASANTFSNYTVSNLNIFADAANYDYHLAGTPSGIVDAGTSLSEVTNDIDCDNRSGGTDIGADEAAGGNNDNGNECAQQGQACNDGNNCTTGSTYDANCNCVGGNYTDADGDGLCIGDDPNDNDPCNPNSCGGCDVFDEENFDSGWGIWNDGGTDVRRNSRDAAYANSGNRCVRLRDNTGSASSMYTDALDMSAVTSVDVSFSYIAMSMENNEDFFLEFSNDNGTSYAVVGRWIRGTDFDNGTRYNETVSIDGPFSSNTRIRIRCDASGNGDLVYIDDVNIEACGGTIVPAKLEVLPSSISVNLYPNPANHSIQLDCEISENAQAQIAIYDAFGKLVKQIPNVELLVGAPTEVEVSQLPAGVYFCTLQSDKWQTVKKFVIAR